MNMNELFIHSLVDVFIVSCDCSGLGPTLGYILNMKTALHLSGLINKKFVGD